MQSVPIFLQQHWMPCAEEPAPCRDDARGSIARLRCMSILSDSDEESTTQNKEKKIQQRSASLRCSFAGMTENPDVLIVGAGPAGIAAALELKKLGVKEIVVAERGNRSRWNSAYVWSHRFWSARYAPGDDGTHPMRANIAKWQSRQG